MSIEVEQAAHILIIDVVKGEMVIGEGLINIKTHRCKQLI